MLSDKLKELQAARAKLAELERSIATELNQELAGLPAKYGFGSPAEFVSAVQKAAGGGPANGHRRGRKAATTKTVAPAAKAAAGAGRKRRKRAKITDETRAEVKKLVLGGKTAPEIAKAVGISEPSVANIKRELGLTKKRK